MRPLVPLLIACLGACSPTTLDHNADDPVTVTIDVKENPKTEDLWLRLAKDELAGLALVAADAVLFPSADAARAAAPKRDPEPKSFRTVHILADEGDVVKVRTWLSPRVREGMAAALTDYDLTLYATRAQLIPVIRSAVSEVFEDGSGYVLQEGMALSIDQAVEPLDAQLRGASFTIGADHVGLSFPLEGKDAPLDLDEAKELACERVAQRWNEGEHNRTRFVPREEVVARERAEAEQRRRERASERGDSVGGLGDFDMSGFGRGGFGGDSRTCSMVDRSDGGEKGASLLLNGAPFMQPIDVPGDRCFMRVSVYRAASDQQALVDLSFARVDLRVIASREALRAAGGCGGIGGIGEGYGGRRKPAPPPKVKAVSGKKKVYFPDGTFAGYHMRGTTKLREAELVSGRSCIEHANVSTRICFDADDIIEVDDDRRR